MYTTFKFLIKQSYFYPEHPPCPERGERQLAVIGDDVSVRPHAKRAHVLGKTRHFR